MFDPNWPGITQYPDWFVTIKKLCAAFHDLVTSAFGNKLDDTLVDWTNADEEISSQIQKWDYDFRNIMNLFDESHKKNEFPTSRYYIL